MSSEFLLSHSPVTPSFQFHEASSSSSSSSSPSSSSSSSSSSWVPRFLIDFRPDRDRPLDNASNSSTVASDVYDISPLIPEHYMILIQVMDDYLLPVVMLLGILGNTLSLIVYVSTPRLSRQTSSVYLAFLSGVDNAYLLFYCMVWFNFIGINIYHQDGWCQTIFYSMYVCNFLAAWTVVSFTCERWIIVFRPLLRRSLCTRRRAFKNMVFLTALALFLYSYSLLTVFVEDQYPDKPVCMESIKNEILSLVIKALNIIITILVPLVAIVTMNASIAIKIAKYTRVQRKSETKSSQMLTLEGLSSNISYSNLILATRSPREAKSQHNSVHSPNLRQTRFCARLDTERQKVNFYSDFRNRPSSVHASNAAPAASHSLAATPAAVDVVASVVPSVATLKGCCYDDGVEGDGRTNKMYSSSGLLDAVRSCGSSLNRIQIQGKSALDKTSVSQNNPNVHTVSHVTHNLRLRTRRQHTQLHITRSLLLVSSIFILLNLPSYVFHVCGLLMSVWKKPGLWDDGSYPFLWDHFVQFVYCSNFSSRFFLYIGCSQHFRYALRRLACIFKKRKRSALKLRGRAKSDCSIGKKE